MATEIITVDQEGMTLDLLLWRRFLTDAPGRLEATYARPLNRPIADAGCVLPLGTKVEVDVKPTNTSATAPVAVPVRLWG